MIDVWLLWFKTVASSMKIIHKHTICIPNQHILNEAPKGVYPQRYYILAIYLKNHEDILFRAVPI